MPNIPNTTITNIVVNEEFVGYSTTPTQDYVLHDKNYDILRRAELRQQTEKAVMINGF